MDVFEKYEIERGLARVKTLLECGVVNDPKSPLFLSAITEILIHLRDLTHKSKSLNHRIDFDSDINKTEYVKDVTDLIRFMRDAFCHSNVPNHYLEPKKLLASMNIIAGVGAMRIGNYRHESKYNDDIAICAGPHTLYISRHVVRAFNELNDFLTAIINDNTQL